MYCELCLQVYNITNIDRMLAFLHIVNGSAMSVLSRCIISIFFGWLFVKNKSAEFILLLCSWELIFLMMCRRYTYISAMNNKCFRTLSIVLCLTLHCIGIALELHLKIGRFRFTKSLEFYHKIGCYGQLLKRTWTFINKTDIF